MLISILYKIFQKIKEEGMHQINSMEHYLHIKILKWEIKKYIIKLKKWCYKREHYTTISLVNIDTKILNKILTKQLQKCITRVILCDQVGFISGTQTRFSIYKPTNVIHHVNQMKNKDNMFISIDEKKQNVWQNSTLIHDKNSTKWV